MFLRVILIISGFILFFSNTAQSANLKHNLYFASIDTIIPKDANTLETKTSLLSGDKFIILDSTTKRFQNVNFSTITQKILSSAQLQQRGNDSSIMYKYIGNYGVTPALTPPSISFRALNTSGEYYEYYNGTWNFIAQMITGTAQTINGDKTFTGKIVVNGITSNGVSSNGTATTAAITTKGVVSQRDTTVNTDFTLDGNYGMVGVDCTNGSHFLTMPNESNTRNWVFQLRKEDNTTNPLILKRSDGTILYTISSKFSLSFKNKNSLWVRIY